jgi:hypothetical protein
MYLHITYSKITIFDFPTNAVWLYTSIKYIPVGK